MTKQKYQRIVSAVLTAAVLACPSLFAQQSLDQRGATLDATPGLFLTWDADPLKPGEVFLSTGSFRFNRDPGSITITKFPVAGAVGFYGRFEAFGAWEGVKRVEATDILTYRIPPDGIPYPSQSPSGERLFTMSAPFMDVPLATGTGDLSGNLKFNFYSQRTGRPVSFSLVLTGKVPGHKTFSALNRGLTTGDTEVGFGALGSKRFLNGTQLHGNVLWQFSGDPVVQGVGISDIHHRFLVRGGIGYPVKPSLQAIGEVQFFDYFGHDVPGLDPTKPVDIVIGMRAFAGRAVHMGGGYVASVNHIQDDPVRGVRSAPTHGFVFQFGVAFKRD